MENKNENQSDNALVPDVIVPSGELEYWASLGHTDRVRTLLSIKVNVNAADTDGYTALHAAAENGHMEIVALLVAAGASVNARCGGAEGSSPEDLARQSGHIEIADFLQNAV